MEEGTGTLPEWATWAPADGLAPYTVGIEEEVMLLDATTWGLVHRVDEVLPLLRDASSGSFTAEIHDSELETQTAPHERVDAAIGELGKLRTELADVLRPLSLRAASAGTHPFTVWQETAVSAGERYERIYELLRELARREPTFGLHVHVGVPDPEAAIRAYNRLRVSVPLLLALSANSPFWQGRDTGLASARTPVFQAFPRVGIPRAFGDYAEYADAVDLMIRSGAIPEPTFLWWDVRPQPRFATVELRIMDAQATLADTAALAALVQCLVRLEVEEGERLPAPDAPQEVLAENRFLASRDGMEAELIEPALERRVPAQALLADLLVACRPHAQALGCARELEDVSRLAAATGAQRQRERLRGLGSLPELVAVLADDFLLAP